ncbi:MAG: hypothetical protein H0T92_11395 [Pyrinomonadaceae bacterium]|nr:hypothetical protein [Pyrinomonadaceae bacterium]
MIMLKKYLSLTLVVLVAHMICAAPAIAKSKAEKEIEFAGKVKAGIAKIGTGPEARVKLKLRDKTKLEGYISEAGENSFVVTDAKTGVATTVAYPQVKTVKGNNLSKGAWITIGVIAGIGVVLLALFLERCRNEGGC